MNAREEAERIEEVSAEIHKCYCRAYEKRFGKPYWTNGDYSKLDEATKDYDREMARFHLEALQRREKEAWNSALDEAVRVAKGFDYCKVHDAHDYSECCGHQCHPEIANEIGKLRKP